MTTEAVRLLHVDDEPDFAEVAATFFEQESDRIEVTTATSAAEGLERLSEGAFDCIVSDYDMPGLDGIEFLEAVRVEYPEVPVILFTGKGSEEIAAEAVRAGATDYIQKSGGTDQYALLANRATNAAEKYAAEQEAQETHRRFRKLLEESADYVHVLDPDGTVTYVSPAIEHVLGYEPGEILGENALDYIHPEDRSPITEQTEDITAEPGAEATVEIRVRHADGDWRWIEVRARNLLDDPDVEGIVANARDITDRRESQATAEWHRRLIENLGEGVYVRDEDHEYQFVSHRVDDAPFSEADWVGRSASYLADIGVFSEHEVAAIENAADAIFDGEREEARLVTEPTHPEGTEAIELHLRAVESPAGEEMVLGTTRDTTDRRRRTAQLEEYERLVQTMGDSVYSIDFDGEYIRVNDAFEDLSGYSRERLIAEGPELVLDDEGLEQFENAIRRLLGAGEGLETVQTHLHTADGRAVPVEATLTLLPGEDGGYRGTVGVIRDITERRERKQDLERYETIVRAFPDEVYTLDADGYLTSVIPPAGSQKTTTGYDPEELVGQHVSTVMPEEDIERGEELIREVLASGEERSVSFEMHTVTKDGEQTPHENHIALLPGEDGEFRGTVGVLRNIADRKENEHRLKRQNERLEQFASVVSHDLRNPLNVASARLELAQEECDSPHLENVGEAHERMNRLIESLLTLAQEGERPDAVETLSLEDLVEQCWAHVDTGEAALVVDTDRTIRAEETRARQLFENLVRNAVEHTADGPVTVRVGDLPDGFYVEDDGPGILPDSREDVFEAGYSTADGGTGLGLTIVTETAEAHGWGVTVAEGNDGGARFEFTGVS